MWKFTLLALTTVSGAGFGPTTTDDTEAANIPPR
jgi:hypothetical protein